MRFILIPQLIYPGTVCTDMQTVSIDADKVFKVTSHSSVSNDGSVKEVQDCCIITFIDGKKEWATLSIQEMQKLLNGPGKDFVELTLAEVTSITRMTHRKAFVLPELVASVTDGQEGRCNVSMSDDKTVYYVNDTAENTKALLGLKVK